MAAIAGALQKRSEVRLLCQGKDTEPGFMHLLLYTMRLFFYLMLAATAGALQKRSEVRLFYQRKGTDPVYLQLLQYDGVLLPDAGCHCWGPAEAV